MPTPQEYMAVRAPAFSTDPLIDTYIEQAELETGYSYCNDSLRNKAIFLLAAHWMALQERNSGGNGIAAPGSIKGEKEGDLSRTYGDVGGADSNIDSFLSQTSWGVELDNLQKSCFILPMTRHTT